MSNNILIHSESRNPSSEYVLIHHGIAGQKWGKRNGPPYPLDYNDHSAAEKKGDYRFGGKSDKPLKKVVNPNDHHALDGIDKNFVVNTATSAVLKLDPISALASVGVRGAKASVGAVKAKKYEKEREKLETDKSTGFKLKDKNKQYTIEDDAKRVNPSVNNFNTNTKSNCMLCTTTYDLRRRGYDVTANTASIGYNANDLKRWYPNSKIKTYNEPITATQQKYIDRMASKGPQYKQYAEAIIGQSKKRTKETIQKVSKDLLAQGDGARGNLMIAWGPGSGHSVAYENVKGKTKVIDAQSNKIYNLDAFLKKTKGDVSYARLDNVDINTNAIKEASKS